MLEYLDDAVQEGYKWVLVLPPAYFPGLSTPGVVEGFFREVSAKAEEKGVGTVIYNFPGVCNGVDLSSAVIAKLAGENRGVVGVKLTCGSVAKITRLAAELEKEEFSCFGGQSDFLLGGLAVGSAGCIAAFANVVPRVVSRVWELWREGKREEALRLHGKAALAEGAVKEGGVAAVKYAAGLLSLRRAGLEDVEGKVAMRKPYGELADDRKTRIGEALKEILEVEDGLWAEERQQCTF